LGLGCPHILGPAEAVDQAELLLAVVTLAAKTLHPNLASPDYTAAGRFANRATPSKSAKEDFVNNQPSALWAVFTFHYNRLVLNTEIDANAAIVGSTLVLVDRGSILPPFPSIIAFAA
jgi:hypothetical protein